MPKEIIIPVEIGGVTFKNPFYVASGPTTKSVKQLKRIEETGWAAASIKLTIDPTPYVNRKPRYAIFNDRDALCFTAEKRLEFEQGLKLMEDAKKELSGLLLFANITYAGDKGYLGWVNMAKKFEEAGADIIELNMCCPNMSYNMELTSGNDKACNVQTGASLGQQGDVVSQIVREIKKAVNIPLFVKLTPEGGRIAKVAQTLYAAGADAVGGTANRLGIPPIDLENPEKAVYHLQEEISMSCHCGGWLKPLAQRDTYEIRKVNGSKPRIMAAGGIRNHKDAIEMVMCGADLLGVCAETLISGFDIVRPMVKGLKQWMDAHHYNSLQEFRDAIVSKVKTAPELTLYGGYAKIKDPHLAAPCKDACPHHVPAQAYVRKVAERDFKRAYELIANKGPLQQTCGYVCSHPCEDACTRGVNGNPVRIRDIKRFVFDYAKQNGWKQNNEAQEPNGHRVAVVGSGPAGISNAYYLAKAGYDVTVFEREQKTGGMLRYALPGFRMADGLIDDEIQKLLDMGVKIVTGKALGRDFSIDSLKNDDFEAVFLGIGAQQGRALEIPGEHTKGVINAVDFLKRVSLGEKPNVGNTVVVLGGGFTAVDSARTAKRLGAQNVYIAYRRTKEQMPATAEEIAEAEVEGIRIMYLVSPVEVVESGGRLGLKMSNQVLGGRDDTQRRRPESVNGAQFTLPCDTVIVAIGQQVEPVGGIDLKNGAIKADEESLRVQEGVFAGGDSVEVKTIIAAVAAGKKAAVSIDKFIRGEQAILQYEPQGGVVDKEAVLKRTGYFKDNEKLSLETQEGHERVKNFEPYTRTMTEQEAVSEASRCLACGCGEGCEICKTICSEFTIHVEDFDTLAVDNSDCVACGMCFNRCPNQNIEMVNTGEPV